MRTWMKSPARQLRRIGERIAVHSALGTVKVVRALPSRWVLKTGDWAGSAMYFIDARGRRAARHNLRTVYGDDIRSSRIRQITRDSMRQATRAILLLLHIQPMTREKYRKWVDCPDIESAPEFERMRAKGGVLFSAHIGNWEMLPGTRVAYPTLPPAVALFEAIPSRVINEILQKLRSHPDLIRAFRKGGARAITRAVADGNIAAMLVDRNVRSQLGGVYAPFFGREVRTTPLPAWLALRYDVPLHPIFCLPDDSGDRYRLWVGPDVAADVPPGTEREQIREILTRMNRIIEDIIRAQPELWNWTLKRFKGRPTEALDGYPPYSHYDPDRR